MKVKTFYSLVVILVLAILSLGGIILSRVYKTPLKDNVVNITLITDTNYIETTMTSMYSAIENKNKNTKYHFYIVTEGVNKSGEERMLKLKALAPDTVEITFIPRLEPDLPYENMQRFLQYKVGLHKIYLPEILSKLDKVIYMDGDTIVLKDLSELYSLNVDNIYATVAKDGIYYRYPDEMAEMGFDKRGFYFNSGVMLHNLKEQRQDNTIEKLVDYVKTHQDFYGDQDVLNVVFGNKLRLMSYRYNCISTFFEADDLGFLSEYFGEKLPSNTIDIYKKATIIHYAGDKPWETRYQPLYLKDIWYSYYEKVKRL